MASTLGQRLREALTRKQMLPAGLARSTGISEATISNWLNDVVRPAHVKAEHLFRIADALDLHPRALLYGEQAKPPEWADRARSQPLQHELHMLAAQQVIGALEERGLRLPPEKLSQAIVLAYELLEEGMPEAKVLRFVRAAVA